MKLLIIRHGDPDYALDSLTPKGRREAELLAERIKRESPDHCYCSILGRAKATAAPSLNAIGKTAEYCEWLREFCSDEKFKRDENKKYWDYYPSEYSRDPMIFDNENWVNAPQYSEKGGGKEAVRICAEFDKLLARHGYERSGKIYRAVRPNSDTVALFCHFGVECVLLAHLLNIAAPTLLMGTMAAPSSVTTVYTEERQEGVAMFRIQSFGDTSHLYAGNEPISFSGRFCELYTNEDERH